MGASEGALCAAGWVRGLTSRAGAGLRVHVERSCRWSRWNWLLPQLDAQMAAGGEAFIAPGGGAQARPARRRAPPLSSWEHKPGRRRALQQRFPSRAVCKARALRYRVHSRARAALPTCCRARAATHFPPYAQRTLPACPLTCASAAASTAERAHSGL